MKEHKYFITAAIILILAVVSLFWGIKRQIRYSDTENWKETEGEIVSFQEKHLKADGQTGARDVVVYDMEYEYVVKGNKFISSNISYKNISQLSIKMKFENVKDVAVFYNPENPGQSVLINGSVPFSFNWIIYLGIILMFTGIITLLMAFVEKSFY